MLQLRTENIKGQLCVIVENEQILQINPFTFDEKEKVVTSLEMLVYAQEMTDKQFFSVLKIIEEIRDNVNILTLHLNSIPEYVPEILNRIDVLEKNSLTKDFGQLIIEKMENKSDIDSQMTKLKALSFISLAIAIVAIIGMIIIYNS